MSTEHDQSADDTEAHIRIRQVEDADTDADTATDADGHRRWIDQVEDAGTDTEGHVRARHPREAGSDGDDVEGHRRAP
jgi:hypothetical protein